MSLEPEEYSDEPALEADSPDDFQPSPAQLDSGAEPEEGESVQQSNSSEDVSAQLRDMFGRYGETNKRMDLLNDKLDAIGSNLSAKTASEPESREDSIYDTMDAAQRTAANQLVEHHPIVKELREFKDNIEGGQQNRQQQNLRNSQDMLAEAVESIKKDHGAKEAEVVGEELYQIAELTQWNLEHPYFKSKVQGHIDRLGGNNRDKQQGRQRATSERGGAKSSGGRLPTAKRKTPQGKEYYSFQAAAEIAEELASRNRTRK
jgi:Xaa-Pro aminopeptidase